MNQLLERLLGEATRLTRSGRLGEATAAIQNALRSAGLDTTAAHAPDRTPGAPAPTAPTPPETTPEAALVIDVEAREVPSSPEAGPAPAASAAPPMPAPRAAAEAPAGDGQFIEGRYSDAHGQRDYKLYLPPGSGAQPLPLVVMLHGCTQNPDDFAAGTRMNEAACTQGFIVLYPAQPSSANPGGCWNWFKHNHQRRDAGEPALLAGMVREVMGRHAVDPARVYVAGLSAGGAMAAILGDAYPDLFAAVGVHSGLATGAATDMTTAFTAMRNGSADPASLPLRGMRAGARVEAGLTGAAGLSPPTIVFHGARDTTVNPANGEYVVQACIAPVGASGEPASMTENHTVNNGRTTHQRLYRDASGSVRAEHWLVDDAGHAWSGGSAKGTFADERGPDATQEMLRFFLSRRLAGS